MDYIEILFRIEYRQSLKEKKGLMYVCIYMHVPTFILQRDRHNLDGVYGQDFSIKSNGVIPSNS